MNIVSDNRIMLKKETIEKRLTELGYFRARDSWLYADEYKVGNRYIYIRTIKRQYKVLVVDRRTYNFLLDRRIGGVILEEEVKNADFKNFGEKNSSGSYIGFFVNFETLTAFDNFIGAIADEDNDALSNDIEEITNTPSLTSTERHALIRARVGQGAFRASLIKLWDGKCAVTGVSILDLLRASHVKSWAISTNHERLDPHNGLLLIANLDAAFDKRLISFTNDGKILFSDVLGLEGHRILGIPIGARLRKPLNTQQKIYLGEHRKQLQ